MLFTEYFQKAASLTITQADNGVYYLEPLWPAILRDNEMKLSDILDAELTMNDIFEMLKLEVEKRNTIDSKKNLVIEWLFELITAQVDPSVLAEETDYVKQVTEFMKTNHESQKLKEQEDWEKFKES